MYWISRLVASLAVGFIVGMVIFAAVSWAMREGYTHVLGASPNDAATSAIRIAMVSSAVATVCVVLIVFFRLRRHDQRSPAVLSSVVACVSAALFPFPFWTDALKGRFFYVTVFGLGCYLLLIVCTCLLLGLLISARQLTTRRRRMALLVALVPPLLLISKWVPVVVLLLTLGESSARPWFTLFHNEMGLGMEILGPVSNVLLDVCLFATTLGPVVCLKSYKQPGLT